VWLVLPVFTRKAGNIKYLTLKEAMDKDLLEITELDDSWAVPELRVKNHAEIPVLILDDEELKGAKQNRIVNISILLKENFETIIPVSCVEQGRWSYTSRNFKDSDRIASYQLRNVKLTSVKRSIENSGNIHQIRVLFGMRSINYKIKCMFDHQQAPWEMFTMLNQTILKIL